MVGHSSTDALSDGRDETLEERADRDYSELLQELRVAQTGVQILFAFLLTVPFTERFADVTTEQRTIYLVTLLVTALATVCLTAPVSHHRILFHQGRKEQLVRASSRLAATGLVFLWLSVVGAVFLIFDVVLGTVVGVAAGAALAVTFISIWYAYPLLKR
jgi:uncharacterized protein DUF6328